MILSVLLRTTDKSLFRLGGCRRRTIRAVRVPGDLSGPASPRAGAARDDGAPLPVAASIRRKSQRCLRARKRRRHPPRPGRKCGPRSCRRPRPGAPSPRQDRKARQCPPRSRPYSRWPPGARFPIRAAFATDRAGVIGSALRRSAFFDSHPGPLRNPAGRREAGALSKPGKRPGSENPGLLCTSVRVRGFLERIRARLTRRGIERRRFAQLPLSRSGSFLTI